MNLWGGRFRQAADLSAHVFNSSIPFDKRLYRHDIIGSIAHAEMLGQQGIIPPEDAARIVEALHGILADMDQGVLSVNPASEDIHSFVEEELTRRIGEAGKRLHTGRSRNDQVALDMHLYIKEETQQLDGCLRRVMGTLLTLAKAHTATVMPGFTHMQKAQPVTLAHHLLAYCQMFRRDCGRLADCRERADEMPLGAGALAATPYPSDRALVREKLGFARLTANSMDAVSDRDFCVEFLSCLSLIMMHMSRFCEELILWSTDAFGFVEIADAYATGSSIMPQKKNPDMAELIRGKTGRVYGHLMGLLTVMKGLPLAYNKDMQEDKEAVFDATDTVSACLAIFDHMVSTATFHPDALRQSAGAGYTNATDAADWLVKKGVPFREAHEMIGKLVLYALERKLPLEELPLVYLKSVSAVFDETFYPAIALDTCVNARAVVGGPAESAVWEAITQAEAFLR